MIRRKYVPLRIVQPGMMIDQAIIDRAGRVLIARRTRLEDFHIDALKKMGVTGIYTCEGTEDVKPADAVFVSGYAVTGFYQCFPEYYG